MDPNATLAALYAAVNDLRETHTQIATGADSREAMNTALAEIAEHASALDLWLARGGFMPAIPEED